MPRVDSAIKVKAEKEAMKKQRQKVGIAVTSNIRPLDKRVGLEIHILINQQNAVGTQKSIQNLY